MVSQERHEEILREYLHEASGAVELGSELIGFEQFPGHVIAHIAKSGPDGKTVTESTRFGWLVGTDGAHSIVRKKLGLSFLGETKTEAHAAIGDIVVEEGLDHGVSTSWFYKCGWLVLKHPVLAYVDSVRQIVRWVPSVSYASNDCVQDDSSSGSCGQQKVHVYILWPGGRISPQNHDARRVC